MVFTLPSFNDIIAEEDKDKRKRRIFQNNISYEPIYNKIYDTIPKEVLQTDQQQEIDKRNFFDLPLSTIMKNIANSLILIVNDLFKKENYSNINNFLKIFLIENRLLYFGLFIVIVSLYMMVFFNWDTIPVAPVK